MRVGSKGIAVDAGGVRDLGAWLELGAEVCIVERRESELTEGVREEDSEGDLMEEVRLGMNGGPSAGTSPASSTADVGRLRTRNRGGTQGKRSVETMGEAYDSGEEMLTSTRGERVEGEGIVARPAERVPAR